MAAIIETREFTVASHWPCLIEYGNEGGYDDDDEAQLETFMRRELELPEGAGHWSFEYGEETSFERDDISGLSADCITLTAYAFSK